MWQTDVFCAAHTASELKLMSHFRTYAHLFGVQGPACTQDLGRCLASLEWNGMCTLRDVVIKCYC